MTASRIHARIRGRVQGVFYRASTQREAAARGLSGWVRNCADGSVELVAEGPREACQSLLDYCRQGPPAARVVAVDVEWSAGSGDYESFDVRY